MAQLFNLTLEPAKADAYRQTLRERSKIQGDEPRMFGLAWHDSEDGPEVSTVQVRTDPGHVSHRRGVVKGHSRDVDRLPDV